MFGNAPKGSKFYNTSSTDLEREIEKLKERIACCTENTPIVESTETGAYILPAIWANSYVRLLGAGVNIITIPEDSDYNFPIGTEVTFFWDESTGGTSNRIAPDSVSTTLNFFSPSASADCDMAADKSAVTIKKVGSNEWDAVGNIL